VLQAVVAGAEALLYPSMYEGFGLPPLEAFAAGTPVVASDLPVIREVVGKAPATLVPAGDVDALAAALLSHARLTGPSDAAAGRARAREFTWAATAAATRATYVRTLS